MKRRNFLKNGAVGSLSLLATHRLIAGERPESNTTMRYTELLNMVHHNPGEPDFPTMYTQPEYIKQLNYTGQVPKIYVQCGITYDSLADNLVKIRSDERLWINHHAAFVNLQINNAQRAGMPLYPFTDFLVMPKSVMERYGDEMKIKGKLSILKERTQEILKIQIAEIFNCFPGIAGITLRHGETYLHDTPFHQGDSPARTPDEHQLLMNILREEICVKRNKRLIYRTWDFGFFHTRSDFYLQVTNAVKPHPNLYISIKHVNYDFNRGFPFNTTIGLGNHQQIIEISINQAGCYCKNSHPYYIARGIIEGWSEMKNRKGLRNLLPDPKIKGFWLWTWGDGWGGPYFSNEFWINLNEHVLREYCKNPNQSEEKIFTQYVQKQLGFEQANSAKLRELCLLSEDAVYYGQASRYFEADPWWCRDHYLSAIDLKDVVSKNIVDKVLQEKHDNSKIWKQIEDIAQQISTPNLKNTKFIGVSSTYDRIKYELMEIIWQVQIMLAQAKAGIKPNATTANRAIDAYNAKWQEWVKLSETDNQCPTLYRDSVTEHCGPPFLPSLEKLKELIG